MAVPTINENFGVISIASGVAYSLQFTATDSPTSWAVTGGPDELTISTAGLYSGTPLVAEAIAYNVEVIATNGEGDSEAETFVLVVNPNPAGATADDFAKEIDYDWVTDQLTIPGFPAPAEGEYLTKFTTGTRYDLLTGVIKRGVQQDPDINRVIATIRQFSDDAPLEITRGDVTEVGTGASDRRFVREIYFDEALLTGLLSDAGDDFKNFVDVYLELKLIKSEDASDYNSGTKTETITTLDQGDTHNDTFTFLDLEQLASGKYTLTLRLIVPGDSGLNVTLAQELVVTYGGGTFAIDSATGATTGTGESAVEADWDATLENTSNTANGSGLTINTSVTAPAQSDGFRLDLELQNSTIVPDAGSGDLVIEPSGDEDWAIRNGGGTTLYTWTPTSGDTADDVAADLTAGVGETISVELGDSPAIVTLLLGSASDVVTGFHADSSTTATRGVNPDGPSYSDARVEATLVGIAEPENNQTRTSITSLCQLIKAH